MSQGLEIIAAPFTVWLAPVGEAFPYVHAQPAGNWVKLGTSGDKHYTEEGVKVAHEQEIEQVHTLGRTGPVKALRVKEGLKISLSLLDLSVEQYRRALNDVAITEVDAAAGIPGSRNIPLRRGLTVAEYAVLVKADVSSEGDGFASQYQVHRAFMDGSPELVFRKNEPAVLLLALVALEDEDAADGEEFGKLVVQDADAQ